MLGAPVVKRAKAPLRALAPRSARLYIRPGGRPYDRPYRSDRFDRSDRYDQYAPRRPWRGPARRPPPPAPVYRGPGPIYGPTYPVPWQNSMPVSGWRQPGNYGPVYQQQGVPPSRWEGNSRAPPGIRRDSLVPRSSRNLSPRRMPGPSSDSSPRKLPSFVFKPRNFEMDLRISANSSKIYIEEVDSTLKPYGVVSVALRDKCSCSKCRDPASSQKTFRTSEIPPDLKMTNVAADETGLHITFENDIPRLSEPDGTHTMVYSWSDLQSQRLWTSAKPYIMRTSSARLLNRIGNIPWDKEVITNKVQSIDYEAYIKGGDAMWDVIVELVRHGIVFLRNVPSDPESIRRITTTIAPIQPTFYGELFDVRAKPNAENVAYTSEYLGLHQDLLYLANPPKIQILHCLENSCTGGESLFSDAHRIGHLLAHFPESEAVKALLKRRVTYGYEANGFAYQRSYDANLVTKNGIFHKLWWSPPFESHHGHLEVNHHTIQGTHLLETLLNAPESVYERKMEPGECVLFDNRRVLHGRNAFDAQGGGSRWLRGAYISTQDFVSKAAHMPQGYAEKTREAAPRSNERIQESLRNTPWYYDVADKITQVEQEHQAYMLKIKEKKEEEQQMRERETRSITPR
ncbi:hypothetical protein NLU13_9575 [Sarocladium strictum]|uniref:Gamma-butyrobetaine dioxygenase n=1 Tax=Sarocladium strictum TaxID=5046 RepID=A0AA39GBS3_SARSR|nr:hypothetical protein NLU13_9575 [Sarocladium strictum]